MTVTITYCVPCKYERRAREAADVLREQLGVETELVGGSGGVFRVEVDGETVVSKTRGYFPSAEDVLDAVGARMEPAQGAG
jgi:selenoprotein W-related protein